jgi:hypothetical protein
MCVTTSVTHNKKRHSLSTFHAAMQAKQLRDGNKPTAREMSDALNYGTPGPHIPPGSPAEPPPKPVKEPEFVPDVALLATGAPSAIGDVPAAGIPFMVTKKMKVEFGGLGYSVEQISNMTPARAHEILVNAAAAPRRPPR